MEISTDWCVTVEYQELSSIEVIFVDYQTSELQCNYQSYIQVYIIKDAQGFSSIAPIALSGGFSVETLTGVQLCHGRPSQIEISLLWKIKSPDCCTNTMQVCCKKDGHCRRQAFLDQMLIRDIPMEMCSPGGFTWHMIGVQSLLRILIQAHNTSVMSHTYHY